MRIKNITPGVYRKNLFSILARDIVVVGACLLREQTSLKAFVFLAKNWRRTWAKRREIMKRRRASEDYIAEWFAFQPTSRAAPKVPSRVSVSAMARVRAASR
jgi:hypothetical protein